MWPFKKKNIYLIRWSWGSDDAGRIEYTDFVKGYDLESAWRAFKKIHSLSVFVIEIKKVG